MDLIFQGGVIVDGTGSPAFSGDIRISGNTIAWVGDGPREGAHTVDVTGQTICPGFVDFHSHTDMTLLVNPTAESKTSQGVTLEVCGNCGASDAPIVDPESREHAARSFERMGAALSWTSMGEMLDTLQQSGTAVNFCTFVGHGNVRRQVVGSENRAATEDEIFQMQDVVARAMEEGAVGLSTGLIYPPSCYANTQEITKLCEPVAHTGGIYSTHMRSESSRLLESVREAIEIGERSGARVQISHLKACGLSNHGRAINALDIIEQSRARGVDVTADQYPYLATSTGLDTLIPSWAHSGGIEAMKARFADNQTRSQIASEVQAAMEPGGWIYDSGGLDSIVISSVRTDENRWAEGMTMTDIAARMGKEPLEALFEFLEHEEFGVGMVHFCLSDADVDAVMRAGHTLFGSDATARSQAGPMGKGKPHPRAFGTFPRILAHYVRERGVISLEAAIRKMTSLAADRLNIHDRGRLKTGCYADVVVFDASAIRDTATFEDPKQLASGISYVLVNGEAVLSQGKITGALPGAVLRGRF